MKRAAAFFVLVGLALLGFWSIGYAAGVPTAVANTYSTPGSPGENCSHGSNDVSCRPDPSTNGKDCEDHGNARGNEDHCAPTTTETTVTHPTTTETTVTHPTTTETTVTDHTTTTGTTQTTQTTQSTTTTTVTNPGSPGDNCSHGSNDVSCRPDPSDHGKDCEDHGNAHGNEDHCPPTTTETTTTETTVTHPTTETTVTHPTESTPTTPTTPTTAAAAGAGTAPATFTPPAQEAAKKDPKPADPSPAKHPEAKAAQKTQELPFTGAHTARGIVLGLLLLAAGVLLALMQPKKRDLA